MQRGGLLTVATVMIVSMAGVKTWPDGITGQHDSVSEHPVSERSASEHSASEHSISEHSTSASDKSHSSSKSEDMIGPRNLMDYLLRRPYHGRIIGGEETNIRDHPHQVAWLLDGYFHCGASIISPDWIISAAHCFRYGNDSRDTTLRVGSSTSVHGGQVVTRPTFYQHPNWTFHTMDYDVGVIRVSPPLQFNEYVQPIRIVDQHTRLQEDNQLTVTGWGLTQEKGQAYIFGGTLVLQKVSINFIPKAQCGDVYRRMSLRITDRMLCAQGRRKDACQGDSGGPLIIPADAGRPARLLGLVSWGAGCAHEKYPGVYTDLRNPELRQWIQTVTGLKM